MVCEERQQLLSRLSAALEHLSAVVREARERERTEGARRMAAEDRSEAARSACERIWAELQEHQTRHKCYR